MKGLGLYLVILFFSLIPDTVFSQKECIDPLPPSLTLVSVQPETGFTELKWKLSPSPDIYAYVVYIYYDENGISRGDSIDILLNPADTSYTYTTRVGNYKSVNYTVSSRAKPYCRSKFSNIINSIYTSANIDTCNKKIEVKWNSYPSSPKKVLDYSVLVSVNDNSYTEAGKVASEKNNFVLNNFINDSKYCFVVRANLEDGTYSTSNKSCLFTKMQRPPDWINADYATIDDNQNINLSFSVDPLSKISSYRLERKTENENDFSLISKIESGNKQILYTDLAADPYKRNYYRLLAVNNCGNAIVSSNIAGNLVAVLNSDGNTLNMKWNSYKSWLGEISGYKVFMDIGNGFMNVSSLPPSDTVYSIDYNSIMTKITTKNICFFIRAVEKNNPHGITGESSSASVCSDIIEKITVPNAFTPNNDLKNDLFKPVLSFTPEEYHFIVTDRQNKVLFESHEHLAEWDGKLNGVTLPEGVYLWFLKVKSPSGNILTRTGTVTILK